MSDAAERFYQRNFDQSLARGETTIGKIADEELTRGNHRYSTTFKYLRERPGLNVVELGYGGPSMLLTLAGHAAKYHIVDIVDRTLGVGLPANISSTKTNLDNDFPFPDASFDVVVAMMIVEHLYDPFHAFGEIARIVKSGGRVFMNLPNIAALKCRLQLLAGRMPVTSSPDWFEKREWDGNHIHYFTISDVRRLAEFAGLEMIEIQPVGNMPKLKALMPALLCHEITFVFRKK